MPARAGVALLLLGCWSVQVPAAAPDFPALTGRVVDAASLLRGDTEQTLTAELGAHEAATGNQLVVVTVTSLDGRPIETFGYQLGRHWGIGQAGKDNGALLIVAPAERQVRIEVGYGLEGRLTDAIASDIINRRILPHFRAGDFDGGVLDGARAMIEAAGGTYQVPRQDPSERRRLPAMALWIFVVFILLNSFGGGGHGRRRRRGQLADAALLGGALGGSRGRGGFGGGFGGGGGSFGGGGASGGW